MKNRSEDFRIQKDTVRKTKIIKMIELTPSSKINSKEGAIMPREVLYMGDNNHNIDSLNTYQTVKMTKILPGSKKAIETKDASTVKESNINKLKGDSVDNTKVVKMINLFPATKIKSKEGAIIPNEVLSMTKIQPMPLPQKEKNLEFVFYFLTVAVIIAAFIFMRKKIKSNN